MAENSAANGNQNTPDEKEVITYLLDHPDIFERHPDLLTILTPPDRNLEEGVQDFQKAMIESLKNKVDRTEDLAQLLITHSRDNLSSQSQIHDCVLALLSAASFQELIDVITTDLAVILNLDVINFCVETGDGDEELPVHGVQKISAGAIERLIPDDKPIVLREGIDGDPEVFGAAAPLVSSDALVLLIISNDMPPAMIAFGSREEDRFTSEQATELLTFLTKVMSELTRIWLGLPE